MIRVGVIGYGYWGPNLVRNFADCSSTKIAAVCDLRPERLAAAERRYPGILTTSDPSALIKDSGVDAVVIATPVEYHFELAMQALREGKHVLVGPAGGGTNQLATQLLAASGVTRETASNTSKSTGRVPSRPVTPGRGAPSARPIHTTTAWPLPMPAAHASR